MRGFKKNNAINKKTVAIGQKFGRLTIIKDLGLFKSGSARRTKVLALCDCGNEYEYFYSSIKSGEVSSCGCLRREMAREWGRERMYKHGLTNHPLMKIYAGIIERCYNPNSPHYILYGAKGVIMCDEWRDNFLAFYEWAINNGWERGLHIDKDIKAKELGVKPILYSPEMCSIVTRAENNRAKLNNHVIEFNGIKKCVTDWAADIGITAGALSARIKRNWPIEKALKTPPQKNYVRNIKTR